MLVSGHFFFPFVKRSSSARPEARSLPINAVYVRVASGQGMVWQGMVWHGMAPAMLRCCATPSIDGDYVRACCVRPYMRMSRLHSLYIAVHIGAS